MPSTQSLLLLATLDGPIEAVNKLTGKTVWTLDGGMECFCMLLFFKISTSDWFLGLLRPTSQYSCGLFS